MLLRLSAVSVALVIVMSNMALAELPPNLGISGLELGMTLESANDLLKMGSSETGCSLPRYSFSSAEGEIVRGSTAEDRLVFLQGDNLFRNEKSVLRAGQDREAVKSVLGPPDITTPNIDRYEGEKQCLWVSFDEKGRIREFWLFRRPGAPEN